MHEKMREIDDVVGLVNVRYFFDNVYVQWAYVILPYVNRT